MSTPRYARIGARLLARHAPQVSDDPPSLGARATAISRIEEVLEREARRRRILRWGGVPAAAAVLALTIGAGLHLRARAARTADAADAASPIVAYPLGAGASVWEDGTRADLAAGSPLVVGSRIETPANGRAALAFATGTSGVIGENADLTVNGDGPTQVLRLEAGSVDLHVAKVTAHHRFLVTTPDAEVEVHGTQFRVSIGPNGGCSDGMTHVLVTEGVVVVRHGGFEKRVAAGDQWPSCPAPEPEPSVEAPAPAPPALPVYAAAPQSAQSMASSLGEQNDLFAEGIFAKHRGDTAGAVGAFDRFLTTYPASPLAQSAAVERMRLLRTSGSPRAVTAARQYLSRYPNGFATAEAEAIVAGSR
ncbi:MAG TPA: FecR domain-containing protein [Polyangiaceae bacterium]|jgi:hypothetical protein|nr:FecR domain-containing protein [Polyangiaceae bacterium]